MESLKADAVKIIKKESLKPLHAISLADEGIEAERKSRASRATIDRSQ